MAQNDVGQVGELFPLQLPQAAHVPGHQVPAVFGAEVAEFAPGGEAVAQVVPAADQIAVGGQEAGGGVVAADVLRHPMDDLDHTPRGPLGDPFLDVDRVEAVGGGVGKIKGLDHGAPLSAPGSVFLSLPQKGPPVKPSVPKESGCSRRGGRPLGPAPDTAP